MNINLKKRMADADTSYYLTVQNKDGSFAVFEKEFSSLTQATQFVGQEYMALIHGDIPGVGKEEAEAREPKFSNNAYASINKKTGQIERIFLSRSTAGVSAFKGDVQSIKVETKEALAHRKLEEAESLTSQ